MAVVQTIPNLKALVAPLLGAPYAEWHCYTLVRHLFDVGFALHLEEDPRQAAHALVEVWYQGDVQDPLSLVQPWDVYVLARHGLVSDHVGLVIDAQSFVHTRRRIGVCIEPLSRWASKCVQLARLRILL